MKKRRNESRALGFTLVELLVVCGIILILATVGIPNYRSYRRAAKQAGCVTQLQMMQIEKQKYYLTHKSSTSFSADLVIGTDRAFTVAPRCPESGTELQFGELHSDVPKCSTYESDTDFPHRLTNLYSY